MKNLLLFIILIFVSVISIFSQNYFQTIVGNDTMGFHSDNFIVTENENLIFGGIRYIPSQDTGRMLLIKLSNTGNILLQKDTISGDSLISTRDIVKTNHGTFWIYATQIHFTNDEPDDIKYLFSEYDTTFNNLRNFKMNLPDSLTVYSFSLNARLRYYKHQLIWFDGCTGKNKTGHDFIYRFTDTGDSIDFHLYTGEKIFDLKVYDDNTIYTTEAGYNDLYMTINKLNSSDLSTDTLFDTNNLPDLYDLVLLYERTYLEFLSDTTFVFSAIDLQPQTNISILDTSFNVLYNTTFGDDFYQEYPAYKNGLSVSEDNKIFNINFDFIKGFTLTKTDNQLNVIWQKYFDIGNGLRLQSVQATNDGGCYVLGQVHINNTYRTLIIKTDKNGSVSVKDNNKYIKAVHDLILYPNPGKDYFNIRTAVQSIGGKFLMFDITGKLIFSQHINQTNSHINTSNLPAGIYIYKYILNNKIIETGKWFKQ